MLTSSRIHRSVVEAEGELSSSRLEVCKRAFVQVLLRHTDACNMIRTQILQINAEIHMFVDTVASSTVGSTSKPAYISK